MDFDLYLHTKVALSDCADRDTVIVKTDFKRFRTDLLLLNFIVKILDENESLTYLS